MRRRLASLRGNEPKIPTLRIEKRARLLRVADRGIHSPLDPSFYYPRGLVFYWCFASLSDTQWWHGRMAGQSGLNRGAVADFATAGLSGVRALPLGQVIHSRPDQTENLNCNI